jgi:hypothetical protein
MHGQDAFLAPLALPWRITDAFAACTPQVLAYSVHFKSTFVTAQSGCMGQTRRLPADFGMPCGYRATQSYDATHALLLDAGVPPEVVFTFDDSAANYMTGTAGEHSSIMLYTASQGSVADTLALLSTVADVIEQHDPEVIDLNLFVHTDIADTVRR